MYSDFNQTPATRAYRELAFAHSAYIKAVKAEEEAFDRLHSARITAELHISPQAIALATKDR
jgi:hypothetical protein